MYLLSKYFFYHSFKMQFLSIQRSILSHQMVSHSKEQNKAKTTQNSDEKYHQHRGNHTTGKKRGSHPHNARSKIALQKKEERRHRRRALGRKHIYTEKRSIHRNVLLHHQVCLAIKRPGHWTR
jgi:hypothetical protein